MLKKLCQKSVRKSVLKKVWLKKCVLKRWGPLEVPDKFPKKMLIAPAMESMIPIPVDTPKPIMRSLKDIEGHMLEFSPPAISVIGVVSPDESFRFRTLRNLSILMILS